MGEISYFTGFRFVAIQTLGKTKKRARVMKRVHKSEILLQNLSQLQNLIKRDSLSYYDEFQVQLNHFHSLKVSFYICNGMRVLQFFISLQLGLYSMLNSYTCIVL